MLPAATLCFAQLSLVFHTPCNKHFASTFFHFVKPGPAVHETAQR